MNVDLGFASARERRLWIWTAVVVATIYSTLGLARTLSDELRARALLDNLFAFAFLLIGVALVAFGFKVKARGAEVGLVLCVVAVYLLVFARMGIPEERTHLIEYSIVALLVYEALLERRSAGRSVPAPALLTVLITSGLGVADECIQAALPNRVFDPVDIGFNILAAVMATTGRAGLLRLRQRTANGG
ncbi:MAG: VanZ family protein [Acidimicrobiales bacterium]|nr:VanZ family protein [Acidimicrobiales bacterium]